MRPDEPEQWIVIPRWNEFQHYRRRDPKWIKNYTRQLADDAYMSLTPYQRALLHDLRLTYATHDGQLRDDTARLTRELNYKVVRDSLETLNHAGFISFAASKPLALSKQNASLELEVETERSSTLKAKTTTHPKNLTYHCTRCSLTFPRQAELHSHLDNVHWLQGDELDHALQTALTSQP